MAGGVDHGATPPRHSRQAQQRRFEAWRSELNELQPHEALADATPASY